MLYIIDSLAVFPFLWRLIQMKNPYIKNVSWALAQKPLTWISTQAQSSTLAKWCIKDSLQNRQIVDLIVVDGGKTPHVTDHGMSNSKLATTLAGGGNIRHRPIIMKT